MAKQQAGKKSTDCGVLRHAWGVIERAAAYEGRSVSDFVVHSVEEAAKTVVRDHEMLGLNRRQSEALVKVLLDPPTPNAALQEAAKQYRRDVGRR